MTSDQPLREQSEPGPCGQRAAAQAAGSEAGDPACWACLVCEECGAVVSEGHLAGCSRSAHLAGPLRAGA